MKDICSFSGRTLPRFAEDLPVECPECGATRKLTVWTSTPAVLTFPEHVVLLGTARERKRWKQVNGKWIVVGEHA